MCFHAMKGITENCDLNMQGNAWGQILPESLKSWQIQPFPFSEIYIFFIFLPYDYREKKKWDPQI